VQTANRLQPIKQLKQSARGHFLVSKRITRGAQSAAQKCNPNICSNGKPFFTSCGDCYDGFSICGGPCQVNTKECVDPSIG